MRRVLSLCILGALSWTALSWAAEIEQTTTGSYSPAIIGNNNQVTFGDIDPRALKRLNDDLDAKDLQLQQKLQEAEEWARKFREVNQQLIDARHALMAKGEDTTLVQAAQNLLNEGKLEDAGKIVDQLLVKDETNVDRAARDNFNRASIYALQFRMIEALPFYAEAYRYRSDNKSYYLGYFSSLLQEKQYETAETITKYQVIHIGKLTAQNPAARPDLADTLNNLGFIYNNMHRFSEAEGVLKKAAAIQRELAVQSPAAYRPQLSFILNNLSITYRHTHRFDEAEGVLKEAMAIKRELAVQNPAAYGPHLANTLDNLGSVYRDMHRFDEAESALKEAVAIQRELAVQNPAAAAAYRPRLAGTLVKLGNFYRHTHRFDEAESALKEAVAIQRELVAQNSGAYRPYLSFTLDNLGNFYRDMRRFDEAESALKEAVAIQHELVAQNPAAYGRYLSFTLDSLRNVYHDMDRSP
jgi:tetratricopeptide (TPR) repeat protein